MKNFSKTREIEAYLRWCASP